MAYIIFVNLMVLPVKDVDQGVLSRIKKALTLGSHESTGEEEAKQAMRYVCIMMNKLVEHL